MLNLDRITSSFVLAVATMVVMFACGGGDGVGLGGDLVGGPCVDERDCDFRCQTGDDYPQGTCIKPCNTDNDCPDGTHCINTDGGICLLGCDVPADCRGGYNCEGKENRGTGGDSLVCSG
ncbi:MAG: hypothetical protein H0T89_05710 [Deltaproteobacteria bacterium]|nr:hypothetical protein [Deltaproteobacteria bacterium]MDQ3300523.1 hypothetical protein [Myxococcota bacterium]